MRGKSFSVLLKEARYREYLILNPTEVTMVTGAQYRVYNQRHVENKMDHH